MNDQQRAAMQQASRYLDDLGLGKTQAARDLREALAQPQGKGEDNGQRNDNCNTKYSDDNSGNFCSNSDSEAPVKPQGEWVDLTDKEIQECWHDTTKQGWIGFVRAVIAKFKEKNTPPVVPQGEPVAKVDANDEGIWADILPDRDVKVGQFLYAAPPSVEAAIEATKEKAAQIAFNMAHSDEQACEVAEAIREMK